MSVAPVQLGNHELLIRLASGGAANVFLVRDLTAAAPGRLLALKILLPQLSANEDFLRMFFAEAQIAARLHHENIVAIAGFGQVQGIHCMSMEYVFGASLAQVLRASARARRPLTVGVLLRIAAAVCDALHYAHELLDDDGSALGLVHRDVTPQNILIGFNGVPKLTDFGIAKATNRGWETQAGIVKGKFSYMSPEQALGKAVDRRSDIFGVGIVLWEALTGRDLFRGSTPMEVLSAIQQQKIMPPSKVVPGLTPIVDPIVMRALRRAPKGRYSTAQDMKDDIEELIARAGVKIDRETISREFAAIYGDEIADRAVALRAAMSGSPDLEHLAKVLGGQVLNPKHLPIVTAGPSDPDPLGLFNEVTPPAGRLERDSLLESGVMPARPEQPFASAFESHEIEVMESAEVEADDLGHLESGHEAPHDVEFPPPVGRDYSGWSDNTSRLVPEDELLAMLSDGDVEKGVVPPEFSERFGRSLSGTRPEPTEDDDFDEDEATLGMESEPSPASLHRQLRPVVRRHHSKDPTSPIRSVPRAPSLDLEPAADSGRRSVRPLPRAPSLDMDIEATPRRGLRPPPGISEASRPAPRTPRGTGPAAPPPHETSSRPDPSTREPLTPSSTRSLRGPPPPPTAEAIRSDSPVMVPEPRRLSAPASLDTGGNGQAKGMSEERPDPNAGVRPAEMPRSRGAGRSPAALARSPETPVRSPETLARFPDAPARSPEAPARSPEAPTRSPETGRSQDARRAPEAERRSDANRSSEPGLWAEGGRASSPPRSRIGGPTSKASTGTIPHDEGENTPLLLERPPVVETEPLVSATSSSAREDVVSTPSLLGSALVSSSPPAATEVDVPPAGFRVRPLVFVLILFCVFGAGLAMGVLLERHEIVLRILEALAPHDLAHP